MNKNQQKKLTVFEEIVVQYQRDIINFHYRLVGNRFEAEDLAQETFIKAYQHFDSIRQPEKVKSWLFRVARNITIDFFRKNKDKRLVPIDNAILENYIKVTAVDFRDQIKDQEISNEMQKCLDRLDSDDKLIVKLLYYEGFSYKEIGTLLNMNQNTLKSRLHRARGSLLEIIKTNDLLREITLKYEPQQT